MRPILVVLTEGDDPAAGKENAPAVAAARGEGANANKQAPNAPTRAGAQAVSRARARMARRPR
jgi:hypothetical protein